MVTARMVILPFDLLCPLVFVTSMSDSAGMADKIIGGGRPIQNWRAWMRRNTRNGAEIHEILLEIARGNAKTVTLLDGKQAVVVPTPEVRARVAIHLDEMLHGKAVTQNEQQRAEREAGALAAVQALSDEVLAERASAALLRAHNGLAVTSGEPLEDAEIVDSVSVLEIWHAAKPGDDLQDYDVADDS